MVNIENLTVKANTRILKYAEGANPETDKPIAVEDKEFVFKGEEAVSVLRQYNIDPAEAIKLGIASQDK